MTAELLRFDARTNAATKVETPLIVLFCFFTTTMNKPLKYDEIAGKVDNLGLSR